MHPGGRWTAVVNPAAGGRKRPPAPLLAALAARGVLVHVSQNEHDAGAAARRAFAAGRGVLACGGDGTVAALAAVAAETGGVLGIVPTGSGNDFARHLGLDHRRPLRALDVLDDGVGRALDLGRVRTADGTTRCFTTVAHVGVDADANRRANQMGWPASLRRVRAAKYVVGALLALPRARPRAFEVTVDGHPWRGRAWLVAVGNARGYGGGLRITPDAALDDGRLDVCIVGARSRIGLLSRLPRLRRGTHTHLDGVTMLQGATVELTSSDGSPVDLWASGERIGPLPATLDVAPGAIRALLPR